MDNGTPFYRLGQDSASQFADVIVLHQIAGGVDKNAKIPWLSVSRSDDKAIHHRTIITRQTDDIAFVAEQL